MRDGLMTEVDLVHDRVGKKIELGGHPSAIVIGPG
jgi:hypothetical protein